MDRQLHHEVLGIGRRRTRPRERGLHPQRHARSALIDRYIRRRHRVGRQARRPGAHEHRHGPGRRHRLLRSAAPAELERDGRRSTHAGRDRARRRFRRGLHRSVIADLRPRRHPRHLPDHAPRARVARGRPGADVVELHRDRRDTRPPVRRVGAAQHVPLGDGHERPGECRIRQPLGGRGGVHSAPRERTARRSLHRDDSGADRLDGLRGLDRFRRRDRVPLLELRRRGEDRADRFSHVRRCGTVSGHAHGDGRRRGVGIVDADRHGFCAAGIRDRRRCLLPHRRRPAGARRMRAVRGR